MKPLKSSSELEQEIEKLKKIHQESIIKPYIIFVEILKEIEKTNSLSASALINLIESKLETKDLDFIVKKNEELIKNKELNVKIKSIIDTYLMLKYNPIEKVVKQPVVERREVKPELKREYVKSASAENIQELMINKYAKEKGYFTKLIDDTTKMLSNPNITKGTKAALEKRIDLYQKQIRFYNSAIANVKSKNPDAYLYDRTVLNQKPIFKTALKVRDYRMSRIESKSNQILLEIKELSASGVKVGHLHARLQALQKKAGKIQANQRRSVELKMVQSIKYRQRIRYQAQKNAKKLDKTIKSAVLYDRKSKKYQQMQEERIKILESKGYDLAASINKTYQETSKVYQAIKKAIKVKFNPYIMTKLFQFNSTPVSFLESLIKNNKTDMLQGNFKPVSQQKDNPLSNSSNPPIKPKEIQIKDKKNFDKLTVFELKTIAKESNIQIGQLTKEQLIDKLIQSDVDISLNGFMLRTKEKIKNDEALSNMNVYELKTIAKKLNMSNYSAANKKKLIEMLQKDKKVILQGFNNFEKKQLEEKKKEEALKENERKQSKS